MFLVQLLPTGHQQQHRYTDGLSPLTLILKGRNRNMNDNVGVYQLCMLIFNVVPTMIMAASLVLQWHDRRHHE